MWKKVFDLTHAFSSILNTPLFNNIQPLKSLCFNFRGINYCEYGIYIDLTAIPYDLLPLSVHAQSKLIFHFLLGF
jgi:hypothetical protein